MLPVHNKPLNAQRGFSLIEVLIAVVVVSIGLLGFASLQMGSMQRIEQAKFNRTTSGALRDLVERVGSLPDLAKDGSFNFSNLDDGEAPEWSVNCREETCSHAQLAAMELGLWFDELKTAAPSPRFSVQADSITEGTKVTFNLVWDASLSGNGASVAQATFTDDNPPTHQASTLELLIP